MQFLCMAYEEERVFHELPEREWRALRQETLDYVEALRARGQLIDARPLQSPTKAATVRVREGQASVTDGPFTESKEHIGGFFLIEARDLDEALRIAAAWPSARLGAVEVRPVEDGLPVGSRY